MTAQCSFRICKHNFICQFKLGFSLLCLFLFVVCCGLGVWQVKRYHFKVNLLSLWQERLHAPPQPFNQLQTTNLQLQHVKVRGVYLNDLTVYVQNQMHDDQVGYEVFTPLRIPEQKKLLLIDRGWIAAKKINVPPKVLPVTSSQKITGHIKQFNEYQFILGDNILQPEKRPLVLQKMDVAQLAQVLHQPFYPFVLRLDPNQSHGFVRDWIITTMLPQRHMAYAVQWFALALVLLIAYLCFCCERVEKANEK